MILFVPRCHACAAVQHVLCAAVAQAVETPLLPESSMPSSCCWGPLSLASCCPREWASSSEGYEGISLSLSLFFSSVVSFHLQDVNSMWWCLETALSKSYNCSGCNLKGWFSEKWNFTLYLLTPMPMEGWTQSVNARCMEHHFPQFLLSFATGLSSSFDIAMTIDFPYIMQP